MSRERNKPGPKPDLKEYRDILRLKNKAGLSFRQIAKIKDKTAPTIHEKYQNAVRELSTT